MVYYKEFDFSTLADLPTAKKGETQKEYINAPFSFDIETSTIRGDDPRAFMYIWQMGLQDTAIYGRTWDEWLDCLCRLHEALKLGRKGKGRTAIIYVQNLPFEFAFIAFRLPLRKVFARSPHHVIYFTTDIGFEFRCSYFLSGKSLAEISKGTKVKKLVGDLDYALMRHSSTALTPAELAYCENDVLVLTDYIGQEIERCGDITKIPLTKTGYVRRELLDAFKQWKDWRAYRYKLAQGFPSLEVFSLLYKCFSGGFTHTNCAYVGLTLADVASVDIASSYPSQMLKHMYPLGAFTKISIDSREQLEHMCSDYACIMEISFKGLKAKTHHHTISRHKCSVCEGGIIDNGRVESADILTTFITSVDYRSIKLFYTFDKVMIHSFYFAMYDYLPRPMIDTILKHYKAKTELKGVKGREKEYALSKEFINSLYGMTVTNPLDDDIIYDPSSGEWSVERADAQKLLDKQARSSTYDLPYAVGVWVTAWARWELLRTVAAIGEDAIYCDTDSIKLKNFEDHKEAIDRFNAENREALYKAMDYHGIDRGAVEPLGKLIGAFEYEGTYEQAKFLGAKRYMTEENGRVSYIVAGLPKTRYTKDGKIPEFTPLKYMEEKAEREGVSIFDVFDFDLHIPREYCTKLGSVYNVEPWQERVQDYTGELQTVSELGGVALEPIDFTMSIASEFLNYLLSQESIREKYIQPPFSKRPELKILPIE